MKKAYIFLTCALLFSPLSAIAANNDSCERTCLEGLMNSYLSALETNQPSQLETTDDVRFTENTIDIAPGDGFWRTIDQGSLHASKLYISDPSTSQVAYYGAARENGHGILFTVRLKHRKQRLSEVETIIVRRSPAIFGAFDDPLMPSPAWNESVPIEERASREELIYAANQYFNGIELGNGDIVPLYDDCIRVENGVQTAPSMNGGPNTSIRDSFNSNMFAYIEAISPRRMLVIDEERGVVFGSFMFQHPGDIFPEAFASSKDDPTSIIVYPNTIEIMEAFKVRKNKISHIMAQMVLLPYKQPPGWPVQ